jgi:Phosphodiester glycosidase
MRSVEVVAREGSPDSSEPTARTPGRWTVLGSRLLVSVARRAARGNSAVETRAQRRVRLRARRRRRRVALGILIGLLAVPGWSLERTLAANTTDPIGARAVEWARNHQLGGIVGFVEQIWYAHHQPPKGGTPKGGIPVAPRLNAKPAVHARGVDKPAWPAGPQNIHPLVADPLAGEGIWQPSGRPVDGRPALWITYLRPDAVHTSLLVGVAHLDMSRLTATLHAGTDIPGGGPWVHGARIAVSDYPYVVAAFNGAFRLDSSHGGYYAEGRTVKPLAAGRASLVTYADGRVDVGVWGRDDTMSAAVTAVRQNLNLIVDHGALVSGLADANSGLWGGTVGNQIDVWRSGVGVDAHGNLIYVAGPGLNVATLAELLRRAGSARAMELDINTWWISFTEFAPDGRGGLQPSNLLASMVRSPSRYLSDGTRDFIAIAARH